MNEHAGGRGARISRAQACVEEEGLRFCVKGFGGPLEGLRQGAACSDLQGSRAHPANACLEDTWHTVGA